MGTRRQNRRPPDILWRLEFGSWRRFIFKQSAAFWLTCAYLFFEYVRPQSIYTAIDVLPWTQVTIIAALLALLLEKGIVRAPSPISKGLLAYGAIVLVSAVFAYRPSTSFEFLVELFVGWVIIFFLIVNTVTTERRFLVFLMLFMLSSFKMSQHAVRSWAMRGFAFRDWGVTGAPGWFQNSGEFGIQMCIFLPISLYFALAMRPYVSGWRLWALFAMPFTAVIGMVGSSSRGALVGAALVGLWMVVRSRYRGRAIAGLAVVAVLVYFAIPQESKDRFAESGSDPNSVHRLNMWKAGVEIANGNPVLGIGFRNFDPYYVDNYMGGIRYATALPHNIFIEAWSELGYSGLFAFLTLIMLTFVVNARTRRIAKRLGERGRFLWYSAVGLDGAVVGYIGSGFFVTVLYYPFFWINLALTTSLYVSAKHARRTEARMRAAAAARRQTRLRHAARATVPAVTA